MAQGTMAMRTSSIRYASSIKLLASVTMCPNYVAEKSAGLGGRDGIIIANWERRWFGEDRNRQAEKQLFDLMLARILHHQVRMKCVTCPQAVPLAHHSGVEG